jgi:hypothetical protein
MKIDHLRTPTSTEANLASKLKKWKIKIRTAPETVHHLANGTDTILSPAQFALYEGALKTNFVTWFISGGDPFGTLMYYREIANRNQIALPYIPNKAGRKYSREAAEDYHYFADLLMNETGKDTETGTARNAYYATLD